MDRIPRLLLSDTVLPTAFKGKTTNEEENSCEK